MQKIVNGKNSFAKSLISRFIEWKNLCELSKKKTVADKFLIHNFMNLIQSYDISPDIWKKIPPLSTICLTSQVPFLFAILCGLLFVISTNDVQTTCFLHPSNRDWYFHLVPNCKFREQTSAKRYHPSETDNLCAKTVPFLILTISSPYLQWVSKVCMQRGVLLMPPFRQLSNIVNNIHKRALKFT